ncbi:oligopeptidase B Serine peptidase. MEROPS family S09A [Halopseudomonas litoralis]|uniref:Oligopeptidase B Serine peptidase. MEROPS family S09A n=1 Tax=Halopseudomonas litoralis TaxID=797277 RepID=A0A1H1RVX8_9GAMM|nr:S9 family peptidase [Halopseudomonas litoralis]SDS39872.1 oligopeptidase B Serine peptidase. MEROPS family S09A [Halopseudomonas litoralis]
MPLSTRRDATPDPYAWLEQRNLDEVISHLNDENSHTEQWLSTHNDQRTLLFEEIRGRIRETDLSLPAVWGPWLYYQRTEAGAEYPRYFRSPRPADNSLQTDSAQEELLLDLNELAGEDFLQLGDFAISPDHQWLAYSLDRQGDETYCLYLKHLTSGNISELPLDQADGSLVWANDSVTLFAVSMDEASRPATLWRLQLGTPAVRVYHEADQRFYLHAYRSSSEQWLILASDSKNTSEVRVVSAEQPAGDWQLLDRRTTGHEYHVDHGPHGLLIRSNDRGENFALYCTDPHHPLRRNWELLVDADPQRTLEDFSVQQHGLLLHYREAGLTRLEVRPTTGDHYDVSMPDAVYSLHVQGGEEYASEHIRLRYESLNRPAQVRALHLPSGNQNILKETPVEGRFDANDYEVRREWATAPDGTRIPISLVSRPNSLGAPAPLYLYGYGAYGASMDPWFSHARLSLLDRGWVFAIAHVRGGADMGEAWYQQGKLEHKTNTFSDFIACAEHLTDKQYTDNNKLVIAGGSAGGLLIGNVVNQRPELFAAAVADVPFVDVWNTMNNPALPLTIGEYEEWGDPNEPEVAERIKSYAPYEQVSEQAYPAMFVTAGYHDMRVQYWEAAKWVAKLRHSKTNDHPLLLRTQMSAGHGGASGRYQSMKELAEEYSFLLAVIEAH